MKKDVRSNWTYYIIDISDILWVLFFRSQEAHKVRRELHEGKTFSKLSDSHTIYKWNFFSVSLFFRHIYICITHVQMKCLVKVRAKHLGLGLNIPITPTPPLVRFARQSCCKVNCSIEKWTSKIILFSIEPIRSLIANLLTLLCSQVVHLLLFLYFSLSTFRLSFFHITNQWYSLMYNKHVLKFNIEQIWILFHTDSIYLMRRVPRVPGLKMKC